MSPGRVPPLPATAGLAVQLALYQGLFSEFNEGFALLEILFAPDGKPHDFRMEDINPAFSRILGVQREELVGRTWFECFPDGDFFWLTAFSEVAARGGLLRFERFSARVQRNLEFLIFRTGPTQVGFFFLDIAERTLQAHAIQDLNERLVAHGLQLEEANRALAASEGRYRRLFENITESFSLHELVCDEAGEFRDIRYLEVNPAFERYAGMTRENLVGRTASELFPLSLARLLALFGEVLRSGEPKHFMNFSEAMGRSFEVHVYPSAPREVAVFSLDVTEREQASGAITELNHILQARTLQLEETVHDLETFSYSASHDLRTPLRHIAGFAGMLEQTEGARLSAAGRKNLTAIQRSAGLLDHLVAQLLAFSRSGRTEVKGQAIDGTALVAEVRASLEPETRGRDLRWEVSALPVFQADLGLMRSVLTNLLANAVKFTLPRAQAVIQVGAAESAEGVTFFVRDNGVGFPPDQAHRLFGVFQRLHASKDFPGTGLGLANVRRIIQRHGGKVWAESGVDGGATFTFFLPSIHALGSSEVPAGADGSAR